MLNPYEIDRTQWEHEARAKIFWGDTPEMVSNYLLGQRISYEEAQTWVDSMIAERVVALRGIGFRKMLKGGANDDDSGYHHYYIRSIADLPN